MTEKWLYENDVLYDKLIMNEKNIDDHIFKEEKITELNKKHKIRLVYDDNFKVLDVCQRLKICFCPC